jgi:hypothetical protein
MIDTQAIEGNNDSCLALTQGSSEIEQYFNNISECKILILNSAHFFFWTSHNRKEAKLQELERIVIPLVKKQSRKLRFC